MWRDKAKPLQKKKIKQAKKKKNSTQEIHHNGGQVNSMSANISVDKQTGTVATALLVQP